MTAKKRNALIIAAVVIILVAAIVVLALLNAPKGEVESGTLSIVSNGETVKTFSMADIQAMEYTEQYKKIVSSSYETTEGTYRGVWLNDLLDAADPAIRQNAVQVIARSEDAFVASYPAEDVFEADDIMLVYLFEGKPLGSLADGGTGPFRIIIISDEYGTRSAKYVYELEVK